jgi:hypothetical protein
MNMMPVLSSDLSSVGYESGALYIRFNSGGLYKYVGVPISIYEGLISASSPAKYFQARIKDRYPCALID